MVGKRETKGQSHIRLISLDIDGTMEFGDPPGRVTIEWVRQAKEQGHLIGSASDRTLDEQRKLWKETGLELDFVILKHWMEQLKDNFEADEYWHVGDGQMDQLFAAQAGFTFFWAASFPEEVLRYANGNGDASGQTSVQ